MSEDSIAKPMNVQLHLDQLYRKPMPNKKQKLGVEVHFFGQRDRETMAKSKANEEEDAVDAEEERAVRKRPLPAAVLIRDSRAVKKIDRNAILAKMSVMDIVKPKEVAKKAVELKGDFQEETGNVAKKLPGVLVIQEEGETDVSEKEVVATKEKEGEEEAREEAAEAGEEAAEEEDSPASAAKQDEKEDWEIELEKERELAAAAVKGGPTKKKRIIVKKGDPLIVIGGPIDNAGELRLAERLPPPEKLVVKTSPYYMNNRKLFIQKLADLFAPYKRELADEASAEVSCETRDSGPNFELLVHQRVVRDYLNLYSPYRGLLLYHGLGSGKTCTSIALAEGMKSHKRVFIMTPASLKSNFFGELKKCGDHLYKRNQFWEFVSTDGRPDLVPLLSRALSIPVDFIKDKKGAWLVDVTKEANFAELESAEQRDVDNQLNQMIRAKYTDINYNGLNKRKMDLLTGGFTRNPFDNATVIIDEAHNFVSRIVNKIKKPDSISYKLYDYLMSASNARVVLLTGTPIINYPNEIGILFNILRGYIRTWTFPTRLQEKEGVKLNRDSVLEWFEQAKFRTFDYVDFSGDKLIITRNPFGFINMKKPGTAKGVAKGQAKGTEMAAKGGAHGLGGMVASFFGGKATKKHRSTNHVKNKTKKMHVPQGLVRIEHDIEENFPEESELSEIHRDHVGFNGENFGTHTGGAGEFEKYNGVKLDNTGNMTDQDFVDTVVRILADHGVEVPVQRITVENNKSLPDDSKVFLEMFMDSDKNTIKNANLFKRRILGLTSYFRSAQEQLLPRYIKNAEDGVFHIVPCEMSEYQFGMYEKIRKEENDKEKTAKKNQRKQAQKAAAKGPGGGEDLFTISSTYRIFSRACCNFAFPTPPGRPMPEKGTSAGVDSDELDAKALTSSEELDETEFDAVPIDDRTLVNEYLSEEDVEEMKSSEKEPLDYNKRIAKALQLLKFNPAKPREEEYLTKEALRTYSPKFLEILKRVSDKENVGLHLIYSQFRTLEGVGIMKLILEANGWAEFKLRKSGGGDAASWSVEDKEGDEGKPRFVLYTGTETIEEKEIILNIYNGKWSSVPTTITDQLRERGMETNLHGETIKALMITASGAEGINLKNTRFVHIVEPYWHMVRLEQVIGRARRICSHEDLPEDERTIQVFLYLSVLTQGQKTDEKHKELRLRDVSKLDGKTPVTTDESLYETSTIKDGINQQLLKAVKETAIDCSLYAKGNKDETLVCYGFGKVESNRFSSYPTLEVDAAEKDEINERKVVVKMAKIEIRGTTYARDKATDYIYEYADYERAKKTGEDLVPLGKLVKEGRALKVVAV
jgi:hypothetical protein